MSSVSLTIWRYGQQFESIFPRINTKSPLEAARNYSQFVAEAAKLRAKMHLNIQNVPITEAEKKTIAELDVKIDKVWRGLLDTFLLLQQLSSDIPVSSPFYF